MDIGSGRRTRLRPSKNLRIDSRRRVNGIGKSHTPSNSLFGIIAHLLDKTCIYRPLNCTGWYYGKQYDSPKIQGRWEVSHTSFSHLSCLKNTPRNNLSVGSKKTTATLVPTKTRDVKGHESSKRIKLFVSLRNVGVTNALPRGAGHNKQQHLN